jgi:hypothetical protein
MTDATSLLYDAELALASYANLQEGATNSLVNREALQSISGGGMPPTQVAQFVGNI